MGRARHSHSSGTPATHLSILNIHISKTSQLNERVEIKVCMKFYLAVHTEVRMFPRVFWGVEPPSTLPLGSARLLAAT